MDTALSEVDKEITLHCNFISLHLEIPFTNINVIKEHNLKDEIFVKIFHYVLNGWPKDRKSLEDEVKFYFKVKDEITILNGGLLKSHQIIIQKS